LVIASCNNQRKTQNSSAAEAPAVDTISYSATNKDTVSKVADEGVRETLNDIRFAGWGKKEWADNEYIRAVRKHIDAYLNGEIKDSYLDEYKDYIKGKFVIGDIKPGLWGGAFMYIVFFNNPEKTFSVLVQSEVDVETRTISNYECYGLKMEDFDLGFSQEDIKQFLKECPEHKMW
jgi:hypothetical protein